MRIIVEAVWKHGLKRRKEAEGLIEETEQIIGQMGSGQFGVYQETEKDMLKRLVETLQKGEQKVGQ